MTAVSVLTLVDVTTLPLAVSMLRMSPVAGLVLTYPGPQANDVVNVTGLKLGTDDLGSPPSGASMIHSQDCPSKLAPGGGASVIEKCAPLVSLAKVMEPLVLPL